MVKIYFICVGSLKEKYFSDAFEEYKKRLGSYCRVEVMEISDCKIGSKPPSCGEILKCISEEGKRILKRIPENSYIISLCVEGTELSSEGLAKIMEREINRGSGKIVFIVGGSSGLCNEVKEASDLNLSVSLMTFPHRLFRVMLIEQVYRGFRIINSDSYHK